MKNLLVKKIVIFVVVIACTIGVKKYVDKVQKEKAQLEWLEEKSEL